MRRLTRREQVLLGIVAVGGVGYLWYASRHAMTSATEQFEVGADGERFAESAPRVPMALLEQSSESYDRNGRDLFAYSTRPPTQAEIDAERLRQQAEMERQRVEEAERLKRAEEAAQIAAQREALQPPRPPEAKQPPRIPYEYIGYLGPKDNRIAVFQEGEVLYLARTGELLQDTFKVVEIRYESVLMGYTDPEFETRTRELPMISR